MAKNKKSPQTEDERGFRRIKEQRKPIKNFKTHLKDYALNYMDEESGVDDEDGIYNRERNQS